MSRSWLQLRERPLLKPKPRLRRLAIRRRCLMGSKVNVTVAWSKKEKNSSIKISAKTLAGAAKELDKRDEWGKFDGKIGYEYEDDGKGLVTAVTLKPSYTIQMPTWAGYSKAPK